MLDGEIVSPGTERKFSDRERSMLLPVAKPHQELLTVGDRPYRLVSSVREKDWGERLSMLDDLSLSASFCTRTGVFACLANEFRIDPFQGERAFLIKLEHPPLRNYEVSLIVPVCTFSARSVPTPIVSGTGPFPLVITPARSAITIRRSRVLRRKCTCPGEKEMI